MLNTTRFLCATIVCLILVFSFSTKHAQSKTCKPVNCNKKLTSPLIDPLCVHNDEEIDCRYIMEIYECNEEPICIDQTITGIIYDCRINCNDQRRIVTQPCDSAYRVHVKYYRAVIQYPDDCMPQHCFCDCEYYENPEGGLVPKQCPDN